MAAVVHHLNPHGEATTFDPSGTFTQPTKQCKHCGRHVYVIPRTEPDGGRCTCCQGYMCPKCAKENWDGAPCLVLMDKLDLYERGKLSVLK